MCQDIVSDIKSGGQQVADRNHRILKGAVGEDNVSLLMFTKENYDADKLHTKGIYPLPLQYQPLGNILIGLLGYRRFAPRWKKEIIRIIHSINPDVIFLDASELGRILKWVRKETKCLCFFHNIEVDYIWKNKIKRKKYYTFPVLAAAYMNERICTRKANRIICLNERDNKRMMEVYKRSADLIVPVGFDDKFDKNKLKRDIKSKKLIFIGSNFPPNYQGIKWFVDNVMPQLEAFELTIVGKGFEERREKLESQNVKVIGTVDNLETYYYSYCSVVMPILYGNGMKVKTAEAMMYGMNIFATDEALEGYDVDSVKGIYRCNSINEFVANIKKAYAENLVCECANEVRDKFIEKHRMDSQIKLMKELMDSI